MPQIPRALIVDDDPAFVKGVSSCLLEIGRETAIRIERTVDDALRALDDHRPHIMFLSWAIGAEGHRTGEILGRMSSLMGLDPSNYDYPTLINTRWQPEFQSYWRKQRLDFRMENPWIVLEHAEWGVWCPNVVKGLTTKRLRALRTLKLSNGAVDLTHCIHLRISEHPFTLRAYLAGQAAPLEFRRHRSEVYEVISDQIVIPQCDHDDIRKLPAFFVKANRSAWVNLAHVKCIEYDEDGELIFMFHEAAVSPVKLSNRVSHIVSHRLEMLRQWNYWPQLEHLRVPE